MASSFIPWDELVADPKLREPLRQVLLQRALYWYQVAADQLKQQPESPEWLEALAECCASLRQLLPDPDAQIEKNPDVSAVLVNALQDLRNGLRPTWMTPTAFPPSRRTPSSTERRLRGVQVDSVKGLQERFGFNEREACRAVITRLGVRTDASAEALRGWVRSGEYDDYADIVEAAGHCKGNTFGDWLEATVRALEWVSKYPVASPLSR